MTSIETRKSERRTLRGEKRTCQEEECGTRFYDLNKEPIACPVCGSIFVPPPDVIPGARGYKARPVYKLENPDAVDKKKEATDQDDAETPAANETDEQPLEPADAALLLDKDDESETVVATEITKDEKPTSDDP